MEVNDRKNHLVTSGKESVVVKIRNNEFKM